LLHSSLSAQLEAGESLVLPLWVRAACVGEQSLSFLFRYQAKAKPAGAGAGAGAGGAAASAFRVAHLQRSVQVAPLFQAKLFNRPCFSKVWR
jgi:hypothetical protein